VADDSKDALGKAYVEIHASLENLGKEIAGAKKLVLKELGDLENQTKRTANQSKGLAASIDTFYSKNKESFKATAGAAALLAGVIGTVTAGIVALGMRGAAVTDVRQAFAQLTSGLGDSKAVLDDVRGSMDGVVSDFDLMKSVNSAFSQGLKLTRGDLVTTGEAARVLADRIGGDAKTAYDTLLDAMASGKDMTLKTIGVNIDAKRAVDQLAAGLGVSSDKLSESQIKAAKTAAIMTELKRVLSETGRAAVDFGDRVDQGRAMIANFLDHVGEAIAQSPALNRALTGVGEAIASVFGTDDAEQVKNLTHLVDEFAIALVGAAQVGVSTAKYIGGAWYGTRAVFFDLIGTMYDVAAAEQDLLIKTAVAVSKLPGVGKAAAAAMLVAAAPLMDDFKTLALGSHQLAKEATEDGKKWMAGADRMNESLQKTKAEMIQLAAEGPKTGAAITNVGDAAGHAGDAIIVSAEELKKFKAELRGIHDEAAQALTAASLTGTTAQLAALSQQTQAAIANARENAKTAAMGEQTVTALLEAEILKRQAILTTEAHTVAAEQRKVYADVAQAQIAASELGLQGALDALAVAQEAERDDAMFRGLTAQALADTLLGIDQVYAARRALLMANHERDIQDELYRIRVAAQAQTIRLGLQGVAADLAQNELELQDRLRIIDLEHDGDERLVRETIALYRLRAKEIIRANDPIWKAWQGLTADMRQEWADTWEAVLRGETSLKDALLKPFKDFGRQLIKIMAGVLGDLQATFMRPMQQMLAGVVNNVIGGIGSGAGTSGAAGALAHIDLSALLKNLKSPAGRAGSAMMGAAGLVSMLQSNSMGSSIASGAMSGAGFGTMIAPGIGTAIGAGAGAVAGWIQGLTLAKKTAKEFIASMGGAAELQKKLGDAVGSDRARQMIADLQGIGFGDSIKRAKADIDGITKAIDDAAAAQQRWNVGFEDMTAEKRLTTIREVAAGLEKDFASLKAQGYDPSKIISKMSGELNQLALDAIATGKKLPAAMAPLLEQLLRSGNASDALRDKLLGVANAAIPDWQELEGIAEKYGVTVDSLGPRFQQSKLSATAGQIAKDFDRLVKAGADVNGLLDGMQDEVQSVVTTALKFGLDVPAAMKGMITQLQAMGKLTDENGNALTDLSRLNFAKPIEDSIDALIAKMQELIDVWAGGPSGPGGPDLGERLRPRHPDEPYLRPQPFDTTQNPWTVPGGGGGRPGALMGFADGGVGNFGRGALAVLHGREAVFPLDRLENAMARQPRDNGRAAAPQYHITVQQQVDLNSPDAGAMRRLVRGDMKRELVSLFVDDVDGFGRMVATALQRFQTEV